MEDELTDGRFGLREFRPGDAALLYEAVRESLAELHPWMMWAHPGYSIEESREWLAARDRDRDEDVAYAFAIYDAADGRLLGGVGLNFIDRVHQRANLGYWVRTSATGRGAATAATRLLARYGLEKLGFQRIEVVAAVGNHASLRVAEKAGAKREGVLRKGLLYHGVPHDAVLYSLVSEDFDDGEQ
ncbi:MAG TPA: GNAT family protein [Pyrinomonadaceae bacterium]|nr:GNAT family protein [Pyrinomonadaceae bacterium]